jgi:hypothetical protein
VARRSVGCCPAGLARRWPDAAAAAMRRGLDRAAAGEKGPRLWLLAVAGEHPSVAAGNPIAIVSGKFAAAAACEI